MPHMRFRGIEIDLVKKISKDLVDGLTEIVACEREWFTLEHIQSNFIKDGEDNQGHPFVEILWFDRGLDTKTKVSKFITKLISIENNYPTITVIFTNLEGTDYFENGEHF